MCLRTWILVPKGSSVKDATVGLMARPLVLIQKNQLCLEFRKKIALANSDKNSVTLQLG